MTENPYQSPQADSTQPELRGDEPKRSEQLRVVLITFVGLFLGRGIRYVIGAGRSFTVAGFICNVIGILAVFSAVKLWERFASKP